MKSNPFLFLLCFVCISSFGQDNYFRLSDQKIIVGLSAPRISPSGNQAVFIATRKNFENNTNESELIWIDLKTKEQRLLVRDRSGLGQPQWLPDGSAVSFVANGAEGPQVYLLSMQGGEAQQITHSPSRVKTYRWHPKNKRLAYIAANAKSKSSGFNDAFEVGSNDFLKTEASISSNLFFQDLEKVVAQKLFPDSLTLATDLTTSALSWSPDGNKIAFTVFASPRSGDSDLSKLYVLDTRTNNLKAVTKNKNQEGSADFSPDGKQIAFLYPRQGIPSNQNEVHIQMGGENDYRNLTQKIDREILDVRWLPDGSLVVAGNQGLTSALWHITLTGQTENISIGDVASVNEFDSQGSKMIFVGTEKYRPNELYFKSELKSAPERLTDYNGGIATKKLGRTEGIDWKSSKNLQPNGVLTYPPTFDPGKKYPLVLFIHGGPTAASLLNFHPVVQTMAAQGWIVFQPNYRGSSNLGNEFQSAIANDAAEGPGQDVMAGVNELLKKSYVDGTRVAISGWSYGGWMTSWMIGRYPEVWKVAVAGAAPVDLTDMYSLNDLNRSRRHAITDSPYKGDNLKAFYAQSPISNFNKVKTPTLIMSDTGDSRVAITGSYKLYGALRDNNVPVKFIAYPVSGHFPGDPVRGYDVYERWIGWLKEYLD